MLTTTELYEIFKKHPQVSTDSRALPLGCLFFALKGENFDGNAYAKSAIENGAAFAIVDDPAVADGRDPRLLLVPDVLKALQNLGLHHRQQFDIPIIGIAGSNGKTTTKELVGAVLASHYPTHVTAGNLNNHIGVPLTLLRMPATTEVAVIEIGANHPGEVAELCEIARPTHGLLTNIGKEHLEGFGNLTGVKKSEGELYDFLAATGGLAFVNRDEKYLVAMSRQVRRKIFYLQSDRPDPRVVDIECQLVGQNPFLKVQFLGDDGAVVEVETQLFGKHNFQNIQTAIALGRYFKVPAAKIRAALENYQPKNNRSQVVRHGSNTVLLDCYNANPSSMAAALRTLDEMPARQKIAVLGDMLELGGASAAEHRSIFNLTKKMGLTAVVLVGAEFSKLKIGAAATGGSEVIQLPDAAAAKSWLAARNFEDALILVKGSRGIRLENVL